MYCGGLYNINCDKIIMEAIIKYDCKYQLFKCIVLLGNIQNILYFSKIYSRNIQWRKLHNHYRNKIISIMWINLFISHFLILQ